MSGIVRDVSQSFAKYLKNLKPSENDERKLTDVRREIRSRVRMTVSHFKDYLSRVPVKFLTQGSFAYRTLNRPTRIPPQQMDLDDGAYFPIAPPIENLGSRLLFEAMDRILSNLSIEKGWEYEKKTTCGRIIVDAEKHVDVPFYAIPRDDFISWKPSDKTEFAARYRESYLRVDPNKIMLAHREKNWINSDSRKILEWVWGMKDKHGKAFLDVCRCLKAWRDCQWSSSPLSSILIMAIVGRAFDSGMIDSKNCRIDIAVWKAAIDAAMLIQQGSVLNPDGDGDDLTADIDDASKKDIIARLENLAKVLESVLCNSRLDKTAVAEKLCREFGKHYPKDSNLIGKCTVAATVATVAAAPIVRAALPYAE